MESDQLYAVESREIQRVFEREFWHVAGKFDILLLNGTEAWKSQDLRVARPGVYVWLRAGNVIKVGRHLINARKRALEHVRDRVEMHDLKDAHEAQLMLFTVLPDDRHWAAAVEIYLEDALDPAIKSKRQG